MENKITHTLYAKRLPFFEALEKVIVYDGTDIRVCGDGIKCERNKCPFYHSKKRESLTTIRHIQAARRSNNLRQKINSLVEKYWPVEGGTYPIYVSILDYTEVSTTIVRKELERKGWKVWIGYDDKTKTKFLYIL